MGDGVSKTAIKYLDFYKKALQNEQESRTILEAQVENLEKHLGEESSELRREMDHIFASLSRGGTQLRSSTEHGSSPHVQTN